jgi:hypothetical protein
VKQVENYSGNYLNDSEVTVACGGSQVGLFMLLFLFNFAFLKYSLICRRMNIAEFGILLQLQRSF